MVCRCLLMGYARGESFAWREITPPRSKWKMQGFPERIFLVLNAGELKGCGSILPLDANVFLLF